MDNEDYKKHVLVEQSKGRSGGGVTFYVRPAKPCFNRSRTITCYDSDKPKFVERVRKMIAKYYWPMKFYFVDGVVIGSNSEGNALLEYWRVCDPSKKDQFLEAKEIINH